MVPFIDKHIILSCHSARAAVGLFYLIRRRMSIPIQSISIQASSSAVLVMVEKPPRLPPGTPLSKTTGGQRRRRCTTLIVTDKWRGFQENAAGRSTSSGAARGVGTTIERIPLRLSLRPPFSFSVDILASLARTLYLVFCLSL